MKLLFSIVLLPLAVGVVQAQDSRPFMPAPPLGAVTRTFFQDDFFKEKDDNGKNGKNGNGQDDGEEPEHIRDNGQLVEEAFNQEPGVCQHVLQLANFWDWPGSGRTRDLAAAYTLELPLGSQKHQFSFTIPVVSGFQENPGNLPTQQGGIGDIFLNYRYQLLANDDFLWCAPRFSVILPTGDERFGTGNGQLGYQFNLPVSRYMERFDFHFNAGATHIPRVAIDLGGFRSPRHDLSIYNLGASVYYKPSTKFNLFVECLALWNQEINDVGGRDDFTQVFLSPGFRATLTQLENVDWVVGLGFPIGLTASTPDIGVFCYLSVEHNFRKTSKGNGGD